MSNLEFEFMTPEQKTNNDVIAMSHSVDAIFNAVASCEHSKEEHDIIDRNVGHLELMLAKEHITNHPSDKTSFYSAITLGKEHLA